MVFTLEIDWDEIMRSWEAADARRYPIPESRETDRLAKAVLGDVGR